ncbi:MAG: FUSC family protein [Frankiaceae bacterium]
MAGTVAGVLDRLRGSAGRRLLRRGRIPGIRTAKTVLAAVAAYGVATMVSANSRPVLAPLTALLVVQLTLYETLTSGLRRVASVVSGVLLSLSLSLLVGFTWWSLGLLIAAALVVGKLLRLGDQLMEVPISAMLVLAVSDTRTVALGRVYETLLGAGVGVAVNALIAPPLYLQPAGDAIIELAERLAGVLRMVVADLREGWSVESARRWMEEARRLPSDVGRAQRAFARAEQSLRLNPRGRRFRPVTPSLRAALTALEHVAVAIRGVIRPLADRAEASPTESPYDESLRGAVAEVLDDVAEAITLLARVAATDVAAPTSGEERLQEALDRAHAGRLGLAERLAVDGRADRPAWEAHGMLLANLDRVLREIDPEGGLDAHGVPRSGRLPRRPPDEAMREAFGTARGTARRLRERRR